MNFSFKTLNNAAGWLTFAIAAIVLGLAAEPTGSLWDCGEFISGAYKLQVVHPPGAPVFLLIGRMFAWFGSMVSSDPATIAYSVNLLSAISTAFMAMFVCWSTSILGRLAIGERGEEPAGGAAWAVVGAGVVAGLASAFTSSIWFSAVEGEVYAMSTFFTAMTLWSTLKWYNLPDNSESDRWLVFTFFVIALSIGVHLLSLLTFPALAMLYYFKKFQKTTVTGTLIAAGIGVFFLVAIQKLIIAGIPTMWASFDKFVVNSLGMPFYSGIIPVLLLFGGAIWFGLNYAQRTGNGLLQRIVVALTVVVIGYFSYGMVIIRAAANTPINMNDPSDPIRLLPYLNREQYGERPLLRGPNFDAQPVGMVTEERYGRVGDRYAIVDEKVDYKYDPADNVLFPRMGDYSQGRPRLYRQWIDKEKGEPTFSDNVEFFWKYQVGWMYWRYFMWNFSGRQNGDQGYYAWDPSSGNWISGIDFIDEGRLGNLDKLPSDEKNNQAKNKYYMIPFFLGLIGLFFHYRRRPREFSAIMALFIITGLGIIVYSNQPPNEPRERDYVLAGSLFTYCIWIGLSVLAIYELLAKSLKGIAAPVATVLCLSAPLLMVTQNWDDHSRASHFASRDYASNFLNSCAPNAIIFTYGDNDTYPLWYCQEVEGIRTDVRVVNLSLIAVDWYINQLRRAVNDSPAIAMSMPEDKIRGYKRVQIPYAAPAGEREMDLRQVLKFLSEDHKQPSGGGRDFDTYLPTRKMFIPVNKQDFINNKMVSATDSTLVDTIRIDLGRDKKYIIKDELAILDIVASNIGKRPIYWAVTCREDKLLGFEDYLQLEGLSLQLVPKRNKSNQDAYGIIGSGTVNSETAYKNIMESWKWGNFDTHRAHVDKAYMPSLQTMRVSMIRIARQLVLEGKKDKAEALVDKYFAVFPQYNFPYDQFTSFMTDVYVRCGANQKAAERARMIAQTMEEKMIYFESLSPAFRKGYQQEEQFTLTTAGNLIRMAIDMKDEALRKELEDKFGRYLNDGPPMPGLPN
ncbi:MAG: DUF2723 domain-containing protein [Saprospiraceae bacterium]|nr:DUF2723 domain-containing protein [Saprospiraceae bacterium]